MHPNPAFRSTPERLNVQFAAERGFGQLSVAQDGVPLAAHVPFVLSEDGRVADCHLLRSNPVARAARSAQPALLSVTGPDGYVSPDWYGVRDQVPTWNYVAVHLRGMLHPRPPEELRDSLERLSAAFEARLAPKPPWLMDKMPQEALERMMRTILPFRLEIEQIEGTWKLNQNKTEAARLAAAGHMEAWGFGQEASVLAALMRGAADGQSG